MHEGRKRENIHTHHLTNGEIEEIKVKFGKIQKKQNGQTNTNYFSEPMFIAFIRTSVIYKRMRREKYFLYLQIAIEYITKKQVHWTNAK